MPDSFNVTIYNNCAFFLTQKVLTKVFTSNDEIFLQISNFL